VETETDELINRLRAERRSAFHGMTDPLCEEAADEIVRLRAELEAAKAGAQEMRQVQANKFGVGR
jgi:hypothetical protein